MSPPATPEPHAAREFEPDPHLDPVVAAAYDDVHDEAFDPAIIEATVATLVDLADGGPLVEFAIGTGRLALPLAARGLDVAGMDLSAPMLDQLRAKPGSEAIDAVLGDMTDTVLRTDASLVLLAFNTIMNLRTQDAQVACVANAAHHLRPGGRFVVEVMVPEVHRLAAGERFVPFDVSDRHLGIDEYLDPVDQLLVSHHYHLDGDHVRRSAPVFRYVWPSELDLMARLADLQLEHRWADWHRTPFGADSPSHVTVYRRPERADGRNRTVDPGGPSSTL